MKAIKFISLTITTLVVAAFFSCDSKSKGKQSTTSVPKVDVAKPYVMPIVLHKDYPGYLQASNIINVVGRVSGYVTKQNFSSGQYVNAGDLLYIIDPLV